MTKLRCEVSEAKLDEDLMAFGIAYRREGMPRIFVLIAEQSINATQATGWWQGGGNTADLRVMENSFMDRMEKSGFTFIDPEVLQGKVKLEAIGADPNLQQAREIGVKTGADVVIVGRAIAKPLGEMQLDNGTFYSAVANVSARAVRTDTGEVLAAAEFTGTAGRGFEQTTAGRNAFSEAGRQLARDLFAKIGAKWAKAQSGARRIALTVKGVDDYARLAQFKNALSQSRPRREGRPGALDERRQGRPRRDARPGAPVRPRDRARDEEVPGLRRQGEGGHARAASRWSSRRRSDHARPDRGRSPPCSPARAPPRGRARRSRRPPRSRRHGDLPRRRRDPDRRRQVGEARAWASPCSRATSSRPRSARGSR